jgi:tetratricopeptide (TPR) repeat protein
MRLDKKIADSQSIAQGLAKADTWKAMTRSRDRFAGIAQASPTAENKAALARIRALIAFEFGEGVPEAKAAIDGLGGDGGLDAELAAAYYALAVNDVKAAQEASARALKLAADDAAALYVAGQADYLAGDLVSAAKQLSAAVEKEARPLYRVALSRVQLELSDFKEAQRAIDQSTIKSWYDLLDEPTKNELKDSGITLSTIVDENPAVVIQRTRVAVATGQATGTKAGELKGQLDRIVAEGGKPINDQPRGVSLVQMGFADLAISELEYAMGKQPGATAAMKAALELKIDDQRFGEQATETLYSTLNFAGAANAAELALKGWPNSRRARVTLAQIALQKGRPQEALEWLVKVENIDKLAVPLTVRGRAKLALNDLAGAKADLDLALEKSNKKLEAALVARTWVDLQSGDIDGARTRIRSRFNGLTAAKIVSPEVTTVWAAILRASGKAEDIAEAKSLLEPVAAGSPSIDLPRAQLELARLYREAGDPAAKGLYSKILQQTTSREIRVETAKYLIDFSDDAGGREMFDELLKVNDTDPPDLLVEAARAHLLVGDHAGGAALLDRAEKTNGSTWKYDRERARLMLRQGNFGGAALKLATAAEKSGDDLETLFLIAEAASTDLEKFKDTADKLRSLVKSRLKEGPLANLVIGKLTVQNKDDKTKEGEKAFKAAEEALKAAPPRIRAQSALGAAVIAYNNQDDPVAIVALNLAIRLDPTLYEAYIYLADIRLGKNEFAVALDKAQLAAKYNPDSVDAYLMIGRAANGLRNRKLLAEMITKVSALAPNSDQLKLLQSLK